MDEQGTAGPARRGWALAIAVLAVLAIAVLALVLWPRDEPAPPLEDDGSVTPTWSVPSEETTENETAAPPATTDPADPEDLLPGLPDLPPATAEPVTVLENLTSPWDLAFLPSGAFLVTSRDTATISLVDEQGIATLTGPGAEALAATTLLGGEGGLLGIAVGPQAPAVTPTLHLYRTTEAGNEVVSATIDLISGTLGELHPVLSGIPAAGNHDGGRLAFGPDGYLYVATGDAGRPDLAQDPGSLAGKILRITAEGKAAPGNPVAGSPVWSLGHRNVQGLAWDEGGRMYASEFGQDTTDELNLIVPGGNYGWPVVEGAGGAEVGFVDPIAQWPTSEASPSGIAYADGAIHLAALRGQRLWTVPVVGGIAGEPTASLDLGRLRTVVAGPDGALWILTNNTDGRGEPREGDDRLVRVLPPTG